MAEYTRITLFAEVLLPVPVPGTFTYRVPYLLNDSIHVGQRVAVQFGKTKILSGLVVALTEKVPEVEVKYLSDILDSEPIVNSIQLRFWEWVKTYYLCHLGEVMQAALPSALRLSSESKVALSPDFIIDSMAIGQGFLHRCFDKFCDLIQIHFSQLCHNEFCLFAGGFLIFLRMDRLQHRGNRPDMFPWTHCERISIPVNNAALPFSFREKIPDDAVQT